MLGILRNTLKQEVMICWTNVGIKAYIEERMKELEKKIAKQYKVMQVFTSILRQELTEEVVELNSVTGQFVKTKNLRPFPK